MEHVTSCSDVKTDREPRHLSIRGLGRLTPNEKTEASFMPVHPRHGGRHWSRCCSCTGTSISNRANSVPSEL